MNVPEIPTKAKAAGRPCPHSHRAAWALRSRPPGLATLATLPQQPPHQLPRWPVEHLGIGRWRHQLAVRPHHLSHPARPQLARVQQQLLLVRTHPRQRWPHAQAGDAPQEDVHKLWQHQQHSHSHKRNGDGGGAHLNRSVMVCTPLAPLGSAGRDQYGHDLLAHDVYTLRTTTLQSPHLRVEGEPAILGSLTGSSLLPPPPSFSHTQHNTSAANPSPPRVATSAARPCVPRPPAAP